MVKRLLITGAGGMIGRDLIPRLSRRYRVRACDREALPASENWENVQADLARLEEVRAAVRSMDALIHLGAVSWERDFESELMPSNILGCYHLLEAARLEGVKRIFFASTYHVVGMHYPEEACVDESVELRPDTYYACTKLFGEGLSRFYREKHDLEIICARIGYFLNTERIQSGRTKEKVALGLSPDDFYRFVLCFLEVDKLEFAVLNCASRSAGQWLDLSRAKEVIGYEPKDDVEAMFA